MLDQTFQIPLAIDLVAVGVGSLQGALFAAGFKRIDLLGVAIIGVASGIGGGFLRDILLGVTPAAFSQNWYLLVATAAAFIGMAIPRVFERVDPVMTVLDALSIGMFGAIGTTKALALGLPVIPALFIGTVSAVGGGVLRDVMLNIPIALMHVGSLYAVAALVGTGVLAGLLAFGVPVMVAGSICVLVTAAVRLLSVRFGWSLPEQRALSRIRLRRQRQVELAVDEALQTGAITLSLDLADLAALEDEDEDDEDEDEHDGSRSRSAAEDKATDRRSEQREPERGTRPTDGRATGGASDDGERRGPWRPWGPEGPPSAL